MPLLLLQNSPCRQRRLLRSWRRAAYRPALDHAEAVIDGFQSPHGLELLATVDWLRRRSGVEMALGPMRAAIQAWPGPPGSGARKARAFTPEQVAIAIGHLKQIDPITA